MARLLVALLAIAAGMSAQASDAPAFSKAMWGPVTRDGVSQFPLYKQLGVGIYETGIEWDHTAPRRPKHPSDPNDPAYNWPDAVDQAVVQAKRYGMRVSITLTRAPLWASGHGNPAWAPKRPSDFAAFARAAARRYPSVHLWMIWGEPTRLGNFKPLNKKGPGIYARVLDAAYGALKRVSRRNTVIGGNSFTVGVYSPVDWVRKLRLPNGDRPRMDMWGHNPFSRRLPRLSDDPLIAGYVDFSSLDDFVRVLDRAYPGRKLRLFLSEFTVPTGHTNWLFNFFEPEQPAANWLRAALRVSRGWPRIAALGWYQLYDEAPRPAGDETLYGLIAQNGRRKPAFEVFEKG
jgi:hypothetical protein